MSTLRAKNTLHFWLQQSLVAESCLSQHAIVAELNGRLLGADCLKLRRSSGTRRRANEMKVSARALIGQ